MIDYAECQRQIVIDEKLQFFAENVSQEAWSLGCKARKFPAKSRWFWALQEVWVPRNKGEQK